MIRRILGAFLFFSLSLAAASSFASTKYSKLVAFGDSLSDTGNGIVILQQQFPPLAGLNLPPPFFDNRASNGPVALEILAERIAEEPLQGFFVNPFVGTNFAIISARTNGDDDTSRLIDLNAQVATYLSSLATLGTPADPDALHVIFIGGNDILDIRNAAEEQANAVVDAAVQTIQTGILALADAGAQQFLVVNLPRVHATPRIRSQAQTDPDVKRNVRRATKRFNRALRKSVRQIRKQTDLKITEFDLFSFSRLVLRHPRLFGFQNSKQGCLDPYDTINLLLGLESVQFNAECGVNGENIEHFVFFDDLHYTARTSELIAWGMFLKLYYFSDH